MSDIKTGYINDKIEISTGLWLYPNGQQKKDFFHSADLTRAYLPQPVLWQDRPAELLYWNWKSRRTPINQTACDLITHPGFIIRGSAIVITAREPWHVFRVLGDQWDARDLIEPISHGFVEPEHIIYKPSGLHQTHQYIYVRNDNDAFAVRMVV